MASVFDPKSPVPGAKRLRSSSSRARWKRRPEFPARAQPVTFAGECKDGAVMNETIDDGGGGHLVGKDLCPLFEWKICRERNAASFVALRDELKEQICCFSFERNVSELVDEQQINAIETSIVPLERCRFLCGDEFHEQRGSRRKEYAVAAHAHCKADGTQDMTLPDTGRSTATAFVPNAFSGSRSHASTL